MEEARNGGRGPQKTVPQDERRTWQLAFWLMGALLSVLLLMATLESSSISAHINSLDAASKVLAERQATSEAHYTDILRRLDRLDTKVDQLLQASK